MKQQTLKISRADGLTMGQWFVEDPNLKAVEIPIKEKTAELGDKIQIQADVDKYTVRQEIRSNMFLRHLFYTVFPDVFIYGIAVLVVTKILGWFYGVLTIFAWALIRSSVEPIALRERIKHAKR